MREWHTRYDGLPSSYDWSRTHARRRGGEPLERLTTGDWPSASAVTGVYGSWEAAQTAAANQIVRTDHDSPSPEALLLSWPGVLAMADETRAAVEETAAQIGIQGRKRCI